MVTRVFASWSSPSGFSAFLDRDLFQHVVDVGHQGRINLHTARSQFLPR